MTIRVSNKVLALVLSCTSVAYAEGMISPPEFAAYYNNGNGGGHFELAPDGLEIKVASSDKNRTLPTVCNEISTFAEKNHLHCVKVGRRERDNAAPHDFFQFMKLSLWTPGEIDAENARQESARLAEEAEREERRRLAAEAAARGRARKEERERREQARQEEIERREQVKQIARERRERARQEKRERLAIERRLEEQQASCAKKFCFSVPIGFIVAAGTYVLSSKWEDLTIGSVFAYGVATGVAGCVTSIAWKTYE
ncbi:hypothetical protein FACS1894122_06430 [Alphaproteobacteria bacterium]|nr:hypothetical protein FACS1894122_06430 [Alphaproteobacteria bacterium]